jgi:hypothetical protein
MSLGLWRVLQGRGAALATETPTGAA